MALILLLPFLIVMSSLDLNVGKFLCLNIDLIVETLARLELEWQLKLCKTLIKLVSLLKRVAQFCLLGSCWCLPCIFWVFPEGCMLYLILN